MVFSFLFKFQKKLLYANSGEPDQTQRFAAPDLVLQCLQMSHKKDARLIWVNSSLPYASLQTVHMVLSLKVNNQNSSYCLYFLLVPWHVTLALVETQFSHASIMLENLCTRTVQSSCGGCSPQVHTIVHLAVKKGNILVNILLLKIFFTNYCHLYIQLYIC